MSAAACGAFNPMMGFWFRRFWTGSFRAQQPAAVRNASGTNLHVFRSLPVVGVSSWGSLAVRGGGAQSDLPLWCRHELIASVVIAAVVTVS